MLTALEMLAKSSTLPLTARECGVVKTCGTLHSLELAAAGPCRLCLSELQHVHRIGRCLQAN